MNSNFYDVFCFVFVCYLIICKTQKQQQKTAIDGVSNARLECRRTWGRASVWVKPMAMKLVFIPSALSTEYKGVRACVRVERHV